MHNTSNMNITLQSTTDSINTNMAYMDSSFYNYNNAPLPDIEASINNEFPMELLFYIRNRTNNYQFRQSKNNSKVDYRIKQECADDRNNCLSDIYLDPFGDTDYSYNSIQNYNEEIKYDYEEDSDDFRSMGNIFSTPVIPFSTSMMNQIKNEYSLKIKPPEYFDTMKNPTCKVEKNKLESKIKKDTTFSKFRLYRDQLVPIDVVKAPDGKWKCPVCHKTYVSKKGLKTHYRIHTMDALHCDECDYKCIRPSQLLIHKRVHTNERPFVCKICFKKFKHKHTLKGHMSTHLRPYKKRRSRR